jgi:hypothetical protein
MHHAVVLVVVYCMHDESLNLLQPLKYTISYTYNIADFNPTCFGINMPSLGSACAKLKTSYS